MPNRRVIIIGNGSETRCAEYVRFVATNYQIKSVKVVFFKKIFQMQTKIQNKKERKIYVLILD